MKLQHLDEEAKQRMRALADETMLHLDRLIRQLHTMPVTNSSSYNHLSGAVQHLRQCRIDLDYYTEVL